MAWRTVERHGQPPVGAWYIAGETSGAIYRVIGKPGFTPWIRWLPADALPAFDDIEPPEISATWIPESWRELGWLPMAECPEDTTVQLLNRTGRLMVSHHDPSAPFGRGRVAWQPLATAPAMDGGT